MCLDRGGFRDPKGPFLLGGGMSFRTTGAVTILLIGLGAGPVLAQFLPPPPAPILPPPFRQLPPADVDDEAAPYDPPPGYRMPPPGTYSPQPGPYDNQARGADPGYMPPGQQYGRGPSAQDPDYPPGGWREPPPLPGADPGDPRDRTGSQNYGAPPTYGSNQPYGNQPYGNQPPPPYDDRQQASRPLLPNPLDILRPD